MNKTPIGIKIKFGLKMPWLTAYMQNNKAK
jgi:hypothetical protein